MDMGRTLLRLRASTKQREKWGNHANAAHRHSMEHHSENLWHRGCTRVVQSAGVHNETSVNETRCRAYTILIPKPLLKARPDA